MRDAILSFVVVLAFIIVAAYVATFIVAMIERHLVI